MGIKNESQAIRMVSLSVFLVVIIETIVMLPLMGWLRGWDGMWGAVWGCFGVLLLALSGVGQIYGLMRLPFFVMPIAMFSFLAKVVIVLGVGFGARYLPICEKCGLIVLLIGVFSILITEAVTLYRYYPTAIEVNLTDKSQEN